MSGSVIQDGKLYSNVRFVASREEADMEVIYDKAEYNKEHDAWLYFRHGHLVATAKNDKSKRAG